MVRRSGAGRWNRGGTITSATTVEKRTAGLCVFATVLVLLVRPMVFLTMLLGGGGEIMVVVRVILFSLRIWWICRYASGTGNLSSKILHVLLRTAHDWEQEERIEKASRSGLSRVTDISSDKFGVVGRRAELIGK